MVKSTHINGDKAVKTADKKPSAPVSQHSTRQQDISPLQDLRHGIMPTNLRPAHILQLQRRLGNRAVGALLRGAAQVRPTIQAKLMVGPPGDMYEQEADRVAALVMRMPLPSKQEVKPTDRPRIMTKLASQSNDSSGFDPGQAFEQDLAASRGRGQPLPKTLQQEFEAKIGADFSGVRVHVDAQADQLNRAIQAKAFTTGLDVFFRQGTYQPESRGGQALIAHELTHVVQQNNGYVQRLVQREVYLDQRAVHGDYTGPNDETINPRPGLVDAINAKVTALQAANVEYENTVKDVGDGKATAQQLREKFKKRAELHEFLKLQDIEVNIKGVLAPGALAGRLVEYDTPAQQIRTLVNFSGGKLQRNDGLNTPVDTAQSVTFQTGKGWEIFVMSPGGELHMASHKIGKYHHSSLLAGGPTAAAGSIKAKNGKIEALNNKSGHYKPKEKQVRQVLHRLQKAMVNLDFNLEIIDIIPFNGKAEDYMKPVRLFGRGGRDNFDRETTKRILENFILTKGVDAVKTALTLKSFTYEVDAVSGKSLIKKVDGTMVSHEEVRKALTEYFHEPGPIDILSN
jgi:Domain of unknown function (DUF4157)